MKKAKSPCLGIILSVVFLITTLSCSKSSSTNTTLTNDSIRIYTSVPLEVVNGIKEQFEKDNPTLRLVIFRGGTGEVMKRISSEKASGTVQADIAWVADFSAAEELKEQGLLEQYDSPELKNIIPIFADKDRFYTGSRLLNIVIAYNKNLVKDKPKSYNDLLNPIYKGKIGIVDPEYSGASLYSVGTMLMNKDFGWEYFYKLYQNKCQVIQKNELIADKIADGELAIGIVIDFIVRNIQRKNPEKPIDYIFPEGGVIAVASPVALLKDCQNLKASKRFIDWLLSVKGQGFMSKNLDIASVNLNVKEVKGSVAIKDLNIIPSNSKKIFKNDPKIKSIFKDIFSGKPIGEIKVDLDEQ